MSDKLERRYRRLLACYPAEHRRGYEEEMVGVLMARARPGQRYPAPAEAGNLLLTAAGLRLGRAMAGFGDPSWRDAAAVVGVLASILLVGLRSRTALRSIAPALEYGAAMPPVWIWSRPLAWACVAVVALCGWRRVAAALAAATVLADVAHLVVRYRSEPVSVLYSLVPLILGVVAAAALAGVGDTRLGRRRWLLAGCVAALLVYAPVAEVLAGPGGSFVYVGNRPVGSASVVMYLAAAVIVLVAAARLAPAVRRRIVVLLAPVAALLTVIEFGFVGYVSSSSRFASPIFLTPGQWVVLALTPMLAFVVAVAMLRRRERIAHLIALGRAAELGDSDGSRQRVG